MRRRRLLVAVALAALPAGTADAAPTPPPPELTCTHSGAPDNLLTFTTGDGEETIEIRRAGDEIKLFSEHTYGIVKKGSKKWRIRTEYDSPTCPVTPTVTNTDRIRVVIEAEENVDLNLSQDSGALAPGATAEADGTSEIEIDGVITSPGQSIGFIGGPANDEMRFGVKGGLLSANLNAQAEPQPDVDATVALITDLDYVDQEDHLEWPPAFAEGRAGDDVISTAGGPEFDAPTPRVLFARGGLGNDSLTSVGNRFNLLNGGPGNDTIQGGTRYSLIRAGAGADVVTGGLGVELIELGPGRDIARTFAGNDGILAFDGKRDWVHCGAGRDVIARDRKDKQPGCESKSDYRGGFSFD